MILSAAAILMAVILVLAAGKTRFVFTSFTLTLLYLFTANMPQSIGGVNEGLRYVKEPVILYILASVPLLYFAHRSPSRHILRGGLIPRRPMNRYTLMFGGLCLLSFHTLLTSGALGFAGFWRGIVFPLLLWLHLDTLPPATLERFGRFARSVAGCLAVFLAFAALMHLLVDPEFLIPNDFRSRLSFDQRYSTFASYLSVSRYQSFFNDPNRATMIFTLVTLLMCWRRSDRFRFWASMALWPMVFLTESRAGLLMLALYSTWCALQLVPRAHRRLFLVLIGALAALITVALFLLSSRADAVTEVSRTAIWPVVITVSSGSILSVLLGNGFGWIGQISGFRNYSLDTEIESTSGYTTYLNVIDNTYLSLYSYIGLVGMALFLILVIHGCRSLYRRSDHASRQTLLVLMGMFAFWCVFFDAMISYPWTYLFPVVIHLYSIEHYPQFARKAARVHELRRRLHRLRRARSETPAPTRPVVTMRAIAQPARPNAREAPEAIT